MKTLWPVVLKNRWVRPLRRSKIVGDKTNYSSIGKNPTCKTHHTLDCVNIISVSISLSANQIVEGNFSNEASTGSIRVDFYESEHEYYLEAEVPGATARDITLTLNEGVLDIAVNKDKPALENSSSRPLTYHKIERYYGESRRSLRLPADSDTSFTKAALSNGLLSISIPRLEHNPSSTVTIPIEEK